MSLYKNFTIKHHTYPAEPYARIVSPPEQDEYSPMYKIHKYWARKPWYTISEYIKYFTREGEVVLDPFCGSGVIGIEAIINGREAFLIDLNPAATFIAEMTATVDVDFYELKRAFRRIEAECAEKIHKLYRLEQTCPICNGPLETRYVLRGPKFSTPIVQAYCPYCGMRKEKVHRKLTKKELDFLSKVETEPITEWYPKVPFPKKFDKDRVTYKGITHIHQIFTKRNLKALALLHSAIDRVEDKTIRNLLTLAFSNTLLHVSKLKAENVRPMAVNNYWVPDDWIEENVWYRFSERYKLVEKGKMVARQRIAPKKLEKLHIYNHTATDLYMLSDDSVDYILTDPPYGDSIQYSELSRIWNAWLGKEFSIDEEIVINSTQDKGYHEYEELLTDAFKEMYRVLKPGRWLTLCFHNKEFATWNAILRACRSAGFHYANAVPQKPLSQSFTQAWAKNSLKTDLFVNLYKPSKVQADIIDKPPLQDFSLVNVVSAAYHELPDSMNKDLSAVYDKVVIKLVEYAFNSSRQLDPKEYSIYKVRELLREGRL